MRKSCRLMVRQIIRPIRAADNEEGLTLAELMIAVAILGILAAVAIPDYISKQPFRQLNATGRELFATLQTAKGEAVRRNSCVGILFMNNALAPASPFTGYRMFLDNGVGGGGACNNTVDGAEPWLGLLVAMPQDVLCTQTFVSNAAGFDQRSLPVNNQFGAVILNIDENRDGVADVVGVGPATFRRISVTIAGGIRFDDRAGVR